MISLSYTHIYNNCIKTRGRDDSDNTAPDIVITPVNDLTSDEMDIVKRVLSRSTIVPFT